MRHLHSARPLFSLIAACLVAAPMATSQNPAPIPASAATQDTGTMATKGAPAIAPASTPEALAKALEGKTFFLRDFYQDDRMDFDLAGKPQHAMQKGSFALSAVEIDTVKFTKHAMEIKAHRVGLHFFGALPYEDDSAPYEKIKVDPQKSMEISIERLVIEPEKKKKKKELEKEAAAKAKAAKTATAVATAAAPKDAEETAPSTSEASATQTATASAGSQVVRASPEAAKTAPNHDPRVSFLELSKAVNVIFAPGLDNSVIATLPEYWQNYFATKAGRARVSKVEASALRPGGGVKAPQLLSMIDPASNEYAQKNNIAGLVFLQTVVGATGQPGEVTIIRPIGFGLDEKAVEAVQHSHFRPGTLHGKPVPELVNLQVTFRIYSDRTKPTGAPAAVPVPTQVAPKESPKMPPSNAPVVAAATVSE